MEGVPGRLHLDRWVTEGAPAFWVLGLSMLICGAALRLLSILFVFRGWPIPAMITFVAIAAIVVCFVGSGIWYVVEALTAKERPTPWRK